MPLSRVDRILNYLNYSLFPPLCRLCGEPGLPEIDLCGLCRSEFPPCPDTLDSDTGSILAGFVYDEPLAGLIQAFKFHADIGAGLLSARLALPAFSGSAPQALIPVPLHISRLRQRGFNQAQELARYWGKCRNIPVLPDVLMRTRATQTQSSLPALVRQSNVNGAFLARGALPAHVALVDDVLTTGSTCGEAARALLSAGAGRVDVWCLARVP